MLRLVIGPPASGKSAYAERLIAASTGSAVYIGTLPDKSIYRETIRLHQDRRPESWGLRELTGVPHEDIQIISQALRDFRNVLLDGLTFYLFRVMTIFELDLAPLQYGVESLATQAAQREGAVVVCDTHVSTLLTPEERRPLRHLHTILARSAGSVIYFANGAGREVPRSAVLRLDRLWPYKSEDLRLHYLRQRT